MDTSLLQNHIQKHINLNPSETQLLTSVLIQKTISKKEFILRQCEPCQHIHFVLSGLLRAYHLSDQGKDSTVMFATKEWWITDMHCFVNVLPAMVNIQAVQDCVLLQLSRESLDRLLERVPQFERYFRILMENAYSREQLRMIQNLSNTAKERYWAFLKKYPDIAAHVTQKQIASYLGITPEFLSAIRAEKG
ncbi:MAG: Crp/Fnr family transcriptional regulator [Cyclobacteriaceae bacterium]